MSVIVKGMEMPECCAFCEIQYDGVCRMNTVESIDDIAYDGRPDWCPLVELPERHGNLIDKDALLKEFELAQKSAVIYGRECANAFYSSGNEISTEWWAVEERVENAIPVIEAEDGT